MVSTESRTSILSYSTLGCGRRDSPTFIDDTFTPVSGIGIGIGTETGTGTGITIPYPILQQTFLLDPTPPQSPVEPGFKCPSSAPLSTIQGQYDLITFDELPSWSQDNPYIQSGYRQISHSTSTCLHSCFQIHNETFNIWSHSIPCILFIILEGIMIYYLNARYPNATIKDYIIFAFFILCATICLGISAIFHCLTSHSRKGRDLWLKLDFAGIVFLIIGCFVSAVYMAFFCQETSQYAYWGMVSNSISSHLLYSLSIDCGNVKYSIDSSSSAGFSRSSMAFFSYRGFLCNGCLSSHTFRSCNSAIWVFEGDGSIRNDGPNLGYPVVSISLAIRIKYFIFWLYWLWRYIWRAYYKLLIVIMREGNVEGLSHRF